ncbi:nucleotidyltransferase domain-containing protein [Amycolatopsis sp. La24]|uniref:nucleotidyltransferase domain-containing protein n=1 Tax=Amycolatopsis sp. La24 TaxID=3028304 RepID=UPI0023AF55A4|nr:nucleotidyltransferase domain-containing protein [Amycolatopsis sp. La24]
MADPREGEPVAAAGEIARRLFADARVVIVGGSVLTDRRTPMSDLDLVVVTAPRDAPYRHSFTWGNWPVEALVHDEETLRAHCTDNLARRWAGIPRLIAEGALVADQDGLGTRLQTEMRQRLAAGPAAATASELDAQRYELTDLLDDLTGADDPAEIAFIAARVLTKSAQLALLAGQHWQGSGKWLWRELHDHDPGLADQLAIALPDAPRLGAVARAVLDRTGGPLRDGYRVTDPRCP